MDDPEDKPPPAAPRPVPSAREQRLAAALRANLHRRKAQGRARDAGADAAAAAPPGDEPPAKP